MEYVYIFQNDFTLELKVFETREKAFIYCVNKLIEIAKDEQLEIESTFNIIDCLNELIRTYSSEGYFGVTNEFWVFKEKIE